MSIKLRIAVAIVLPFLALPVLADDDDDDDDDENSCRESSSWIGAYTVTAPAGGTGPFLLNYTFHKDGTFTGSFTGAPEQALSTGTLTNFFGSWKCRRDGNVALSFIYARYFGGGDLFLIDHIRSTGLFQIVDRNTLERIDLAVRIIPPGEDPADPDAGFVVSPPPASTLKRLQVSEGDLNL